MIEQQHKQAKVVYPFIFLEPYHWTLTAHQVGINSVHKINQTKWTVFELDIVLKSRVDEAEERIKFYKAVYFIVYEHKKTILLKGRLDQAIDT